MNTKSNNTINIPVVFFMSSIFLKLALLLVICNTIITRRPAHKPKSFFLPPSLLFRNWLAWVFALAKPQANFSLPEVSQG